MKLYDLTKLSTRMFKARTSRTLLTIVSMGIGIAAILFLVSIGYGTQRTLLEAITTSDSLLTLDVYPNKTENMVINQQGVEKIEAIEGVEKTSSVFEIETQVKYGDLISESGATVTNSSFFSLKGLKLESGESLNDDVKEGVVVSSAFAKALGKDPATIVGEPLSLSLLVPKGIEGEDVESVPLDTQFRVIGCMKSEQLMLYLNAESIKGKFTIKEFSGLKVKCSAEKYLNLVRENISAEGYVVSALSDTIKQVNQVFNFVSTILALFGVIALLISAIGMFNTMTVTLLERTEEIGIMKSIGASNRDILLLFISESTLMGFLGGLSGVLMGFLGGKLFNMSLNFIAERFGGQSATLFYSPWWFIMAILLSGVIVGFLTGIIPARKASSIDPLEALRYK